MSGKNLSVVTINLNDRDGLRRTAESITRQNDQEFEWVVVDGGSTDGSVDILGIAGIRPPDVIRSQKDDGIYDAMNAGATLSSADYVLYLNSGDRFIGPSAVRTIKRSLATTDAPDCALFGFEYRGRQRGPRPIWWRFWSLPTSHQAMVYRRTLLQKLPFDTTYRLASDFEHFLRIVSRGHSVGRFSDVVSWNDDYGCNNHLATIHTEYRRALEPVLGKTLSSFLVGVRILYLRKVI